MEYTNKYIGQRMRDERNKRSLTIKQLSELIGITPAFLGLIERGQRGIRINKLCELSDVFSISLHELLKRDGIEYTNENAIAETRCDYINSLKTKVNKLETLNLLLSNINEDELDFIIDFAKSFKKFMNNQ